MVENSEYKDILISCQRIEPNLIGNWNAQHLGAKGTMELTRGTQPDELPMRGAYGAILWRGRDHYQFGDLLLRTTFKSPDSMTISAVVKVIFGSWESREYFTLRFDRVDFNPITGQFTMKAEGLELRFSGKMEPGVVNGDWSSSLAGPLGNFQFKQDWIPEIPSHGKMIGTLAGTYKGILENYPDYHYSKRVMLNFVTTQDLDQPTGLQISGNMRLYQGEFGSALFYEYRFANIAYFPFIWTIKPVTEKIEGKEKFTLDGNLDGGKITGTLTVEGIGKVAEVGVEKE